MTSMTKGFGGELLQNTKIERSDGYLGPFHDINNPKMVQVGDEQQMVYSVGAHGDNGPFYLTPQKCRMPPRYIPYKGTYVPYDGTYGASDQGQMLDV